MQVGLMTSGSAANRVTSRPSAGFRLSRALEGSSCAGSEGERKPRSISAAGIDRVNMAFLVEELDVGPFLPGKGPTFSSFFNSKNSFELPPTPDLEVVQFFPELG